MALSAKHLPTSQMTLKLQRPQKLSDFVGNPHVFGQGGILDEIFNSTYRNNTILPSLIITGKTGVGKTSLGLAYGDLFESFCGSGEAFAQAKAAYRVRYTEKVINAGEFSKPELFKYLEDYASASKLMPNQTRVPIVFIDEFHTLNQLQQGSLLSCVEQSKIVLIAATTQPVQRCIIEGLRSRCRAIYLDRLSDACIVQLLVKCLNHVDLPQYKDLGSSPEKLFPPHLLAQIALNANGDARRAESTLLAALQFSENGVVTEQVVQKAIEMCESQLNPTGEIARRFLRALREQNPDHAVFYLEAQLEFKTDPVAICRQMLEFASRHCSVKTVQLAVSCLKAVEKTGLPEGVIPMRLTCIVAATSADHMGQNAVLGYQRAQKLLLDQRRQWQENRPRPDYRRDASGPSYIYPFDLGGYVLDSAFQEPMQRAAFFGPGPL